MWVCKGWSLSFVSGGSILWDVGWGREDEDTFFGSLDATGVLRKNGDSKEGNVEVQL